VSIVELRGVTKRFAAFTALDGMSLSVARGEFLTILGASGSGKTTTLRVIAGFELPTTGEVMIDGVDVGALPPFKRPVNTVFQHYALFPHMSVRDNVAYGLRMRRVRRREIAERVDEALEMVQLAQLAGRPPRQLSGGQQQRVALARAIVNRPAVLLLDEPLGALDLKLRREMQLELKRLQSQLGITFIYVTHDQEEALTMSDRVALMHAGRIAQLGTPRELYDRPRSRYVADFVGDTNLLSATVVGVEGEMAIVNAASATVAGVLRPRADDGHGNGDAAMRPERAPRAGEHLWLSVRPEYLAIVPATPAADGVMPGASGPMNALTGRVTDVVYAGSLDRIHITLSDGTVIVAHRPPSRVRLAAGEQVRVVWPAERGVLVGE
jgi:spermidine/putrescine transport system ATP-binding protein